MIQIPVDVPGFFMVLQCSHSQSVGPGPALGFRALSDKLLTNSRCCFFKPCYFCITLRSSGDWLWLEEKHLQPSLSV